MKINKQKRIGEIVIVMEGENPEIAVMTHVFCDILGYSVSALPRSSQILKKFEGHDPHSHVILLNAPTNNINSLEDVENFSQYLHDLSIKLDIDFINDSTYIHFDRDNKNNKHGMMKKMLKVYNSSQGEYSDGQNGLLLISYPSIESFVMSLFEDDTHKNNSCKLSTENKKLLETKNYKLDDADEKSLLHATNEFLTYLKENNFVTQNNEVYDNKDLSIQILDTQQNKFQKIHTFDCVSQVVQILIDLGIIEL